MATRFLSDAELAHLKSWPTDIPRSDLVTFFDLGTDDVRWIRTHRIGGNQLALAICFTAVPFLGFVPDVESTPREVSDHLAAQLDLPVGSLQAYVDSTLERTRQRHVDTVISQLGWTPAGPGEWKRIGDWLVERAIEHDAPSVLFRQLLVHLRAERIVRPGIDRLMRAVATARTAAIGELHRMTAPILSDDLRRELDRAIETDPNLGVAPMVWLSSGATSTSSVSIKAEVAKLDHLRRIGIHRLDMSMIPSDRRRHMALVARRATPAAMRRMDPERRFPLLLAALGEAYHDLVDELVVLFDQALSTVENRTRRLVREQQLEAARSNDHRHDLLDDILDVLLDASLDDSAVVRRLRELGTERLTGAVRPDHERHPPADGGHLGLIEARYAQIRGFAPHILAALELNASVEASEILEAANILAGLNASSQRHVPADAPTGFVPARWRPYLTNTARAEDPIRYRHHWELAVLYGLRAGLRSGEIWVEGSRRYANPATYLLPPEIWSHSRTEALVETGRSETFGHQLATVENDTHRLLDDLEALLAAPDSPVSIDDGGQLHLQRLPAETVDTDVIEQGNQLVARLPTVPLAELLIEIDQITGFSKHLTHANQAQPRHNEIEHRRNLYAAILAQACNFGIARMAELSGISADTLTWTTRWYLREDTLRAANTAIVNTHHRHPLATVWGGGTLSSSDGLRLPIRSRSLTARTLSRYFTDQGGTSYTHVSDQHTTYGTQVIVTTDRDATYVLDEILGNTTDMAIAEHTTDTHGQTLLTFALFDLVGLRLSPRIAKITRQRLWRPRPATHYQQWPEASRLLVHPVQTRLIDQHWDDLLRIAWSIKTGHTTASLLTARLQAGARQHPLAKALIEYGKLQRTNHALRWFTDQAFRRRIGRQLNRGESLNALRRYLFFAQQAEITHSQHEDQTTQAHCHTLVTNACVLWTTVYLAIAVQATEAAGHVVAEDVLTHLSPARHAHINPYGTYTFNVEALNQHTHRPLREPSRPR